MDLLVQGHGECHPEQLQNREDGISMDVHQTGCGIIGGTAIFQNSYFPKMFVPVRPAHTSRWFRANVCCRKAIPQPSHSNPESQKEEVCSNIISNAGKAILKLFINSENV